MEKKSSMYALTDGAMRLIEDVVKEKELTDRMDILDAVCDVLEQKYQGESFESHLNRMHMSTTNEILRAIDIYFIIRADFPAYNFHRSAAREQRQKVATA